jgi:hypothetical protein
MADEPRKQVQHSPARRVDILVQVNQPIHRDEDPKWLIRRILEGR